MRAPHADGVPVSLSRPPNRLAREPSLYLRQHAHNPVDWYPWGTEAWERAEREGKPVFLSVGYASCHWCHVMEREVFEDPDAARLLNENYIAIKVDREERPDLDAVYLEALQALTGSGGWPMSLFLTPTRRPFYGGTYFPKAQFSAIAKRLAELWRAKPGEVARVADEVAERVRAMPEVPTGPALTLESLTRLAEAAAGQFDTAWGGFGGGMKFPAVPRWQFLLHLFRRTGDPALKRMLETTLERMADGGLRDHLGGGFHRYCVDRSWAVPHFEKMLYDNALLATLYTEAAVACGRGDWREVAEEALEFLLSDLQSPEGGFHSSLDADSGGAEGAFYVWTPQELEQVAGARDGAALALLLGVNPDGPVQGACVPTRRADPAAVAQALERPLGEVAGLFERWAPTLKAARARRVAPLLDRKIVTAWNGLAMVALARAYLAWGERRYREAAERAGEYLWANHRREENRLFVASTGGVAVGEGVLDDYAALALGLLALHEATGDDRHLARALGLIRQARARFERPAAGFFHASLDTEVPLGRACEWFDHSLPSGNALMLQALLRASVLVGDDSMRDAVQTFLASQAALLEAAGLEMGASLDVALLEIGPLAEVVLVEPPRRGGDQVLDTYRHALPFHAVLTRVKAGRRPLGVGAAAVASVCSHGSCRPPTDDPKEFRAWLMDGWAC